MPVKLDLKVENSDLSALWDERFCYDKDKLFLIYEDCSGAVTELTYADAWYSINRASNLFIDLGIKKGDMVVVQLGNSPEFMYVWFGLVRIGAILVPVNIQNKADECRYIIDKCGASHLVTEENYIDIYEQIDCRDLKNRIIARSDAEIPGWVNLGKGMAQQADELKEHRPLYADDTAEIMFTSGTTSKPKGAIFTHYNLLFSGKFHAEQMGLTHEDRFLTVFPCFHIDWQAIAVLPALTVGATLVVQERYSASRFWQQIRDYRITVAESIPMIIRTLMLQPQVEGEREHQLRLVYFSLCLSTEEKLDFEERFGVRLFNCYGMTESVVCNVADDKNGTAKWPAVGQVYDPYDVKIVDSHNRTVAANQRGEICIRGERGKTLIHGYYNDEAATARLYDGDGWMHTGDRGYLDDEGWLYFIDRNNNLIKRAGENISSSEVENVLTSHDAIDEAAVIGVPDPIREEAVKAFVKLHGDSKLGVEEIRRYCLDRLADFKVPTIIELVDDFCHTCTGKIQKRPLREG